MTMYMSRRHQIQISRRDAVNLQGARAVIANQHLPRTRDAVMAYVVLRRTLREASVIHVNPLPRGVGIITYKNSIAGLLGAGTVDLQVCACTVAVKLVVGQSECELSVGFDDGELLVFGERVGRVRDSLRLVFNHRPRKRAARV